MIELLAAFAIICTLLGGTESVRPQWHAVELRAVADTSPHTKPKLHRHTTSAGEVIVAPLNSNNAKPQVHPSSAAKTYIAQPGDTVSSLARRFLGGNTKANRDAILNANPSLKQNPDRMIAGMTYTIPT